MAERLISISRKQHDSYNNLLAGIQAAQKQLEIIANTLLMTVEEDLGQVGVIGAKCVDGAYSLVIEVPDIKPQETPAQAHAG